MLADRGASATQKAAWFNLRGMGALAVESRAGMALLLSRLHGLRLINQRIRGGAQMLHRVEDMLASAAAGTALGCVQVLRMNSKQGVAVGALGIHRS